MNLVDKLKQIKTKELTLPAVGIANAWLLTEGGAQASAYLSRYIHSNLGVGAIVDVAELAAGWAILHYPIKYTMSEVYGTNFNQFCKSAKESFKEFWRVRNHTSIKSLIEHVKSVYEKSDRLTKDLVKFGVVVVALSTTLTIARPFVYASQRAKGHTEKEASRNVDYPMNGAKCFIYNGMAIYLLHESRKLKDKISVEQQLKQ
jgi:hypothetical protein